MKIGKPGVKRVFTPAPSGSKACRVIDVIDLGMVPSTWEGVTKDKPMFRVVWQTPDQFEAAEGEIMDFHVSKRYTRSLHENSNFRKDFEAMRGRKLQATDYDDEGDFDVEALIGMECYVNITHSEPKGDEKTVYANIGSLMPLPPGVEAPPANPNYIRRKDREEGDGLPF